MKPRKIIHLKYSVSLFLTVVIIGCKSAAIVQKPICLDELENGTYKGFSRHVNQAEIEIIIENRRMKEVRLLRLDSTPYGLPAGDSIPVRMLRKQTPYVDAVSGSTEASNVIINAAVDALTNPPKEMR